MAGENRQDFSRPSQARTTEEKQEAERGLNIGSDKTQQQEQQGQRPQRKPGDRAQDSQQASGDVQQNIGQGESEPPLAQEGGSAGAPFQPRGRYRKADH